MTIETPSDAAVLDEPASASNWADLLELVDKELRTVAERMSDAEAETVYAAAYYWLRQGHAEKAARILALLTLFRPNEPKYWHVLGICCQRLKNTAGAVEALSRAVELDPQQLAPGLLLVESLLLLGYRVEASSLLDLLASEAEDQGDRSAFLRAEGLRELMALPIQ